MTTNGINFKFGKVVVNMNGSFINIEIPDKKTLDKFEKEYLDKLKTTFKDRFKFNITGPKRVVDTNMGTFKIITNKQGTLGEKIKTIATLVNVEKIVYDNNIKYILFFNNMHTPTGFKAEYTTNQNIDFKLFDKYVMVGFFVNYQRDLKDYEKAMKYVPTYLKVSKIKNIKDTEIIINNMEEDNELKRTPLACYSKNSKGFIDYKQIKLLESEGKISSCCFTDNNTNSWVEKTDVNQPLALEFFVKNDICQDDKDTIYSMTLYVDSEDSTINYNGKDIVVNEGVRAVNKLISNAEEHHGAFLFKLSEVLKYKSEGYFKLGSFNRDGIVFKCLMEKNYHILNRYCNQIDYYGIEPVSNLFYLVIENKIDTLNDLLDINRKIYRLSKIREKKVVFVENAVVGNKDEVNVALSYYISKKVKKENSKDIKKINNWMFNFPKNRISYIRSIKEVWLELNEQGFDDKEALEILINEKEAFNELKFKKSITVVPETLIVPASIEMKTKIKDICVAKLKEIYKENLSKEVVERLKDELGIIFKNNYETLFYLAYILAKRVRDKGYTVGGRGTAGNLLVTYLLDVTDSNPIEYDLDYRMFYGPYSEKVPDLDLNVPKEIVKERTEELMEAYKNILIKASVHSTLKEDGLKSTVFSKIPSILEYIDVDYAANMASDLYQRTQPHSSGVLIIPEDFDSDYIFPTINYNDERIPAYDYHKLDKTLIKIDILSKNHMDIMKKISELTDINNVNLNDGRVYEMINSLKTDGIPELNTDHMKRIISVVKPTCFDDLVKIQGLAHGRGVFKNNAELLIKQGKDYISSREDLLDILNKYNVSNSFMIMEKVRKGNYHKLSVEELKELDKVPEELRNSIKKIQYLFPRAHAVSYSKISYYVAFYKVYEDGIERRLNKIKSDIVEDESLKLFDEFGFN